MKTIHPLALARVEAGYGSQRDFADAAGIDPTTIANIERGVTKSLQPKTLLKISRALNLSPAVVVSWFEE